MKTRIFTLKTERQGYYDITRTVREAVRESGIQSGIAVVFCPHTTGAITINENADPDVKHDLTLGLDAAFPDRAAFRHAEGISFPKRPTFFNDVSIPFATIPSPP